MPLLAAHHADGSPPTFEIKPPLFLLCGAAGGPRLGLGLLTRMLVFCDMPLGPPGGFFTSSLVGALSLPV